MPDKIAHMEARIQKMEIEIVRHATKIEATDKVLYGDGGLDEAKPGLLEAVRSLMAADKRRQKMAAITMSCVLTLLVTKVWEVLSKVH
jgi:hypothetical protein